MEHFDFAVVDVETTGVLLGWRHRIVEIAVVRIGPDGSLQGEYSTLLNPERDVGRTSVHGIRARDVAEAPLFSEIAGDLIDLLAGAVFVEHSHAFDSRFCRAEFERAGVEIPDFACLSTMKLAQKADNTVSGRSLGELCRHFGVVNESPHQALSDARATAALLESCLLRIGLFRSPSELGVEGSLVPRTEWPRLSSCGRTLSRGRAIERLAQRPCYIAEVAARLPHGPSLGWVNLAYFGLLDRVLEDRIVVEDEAAGLEEAARLLGLSRAEFLQANREYLEDLVAACLQDGIVTEPERRDLDDVGRLLGVPAPETDALLESAGPVRPVVGRSSQSLSGKRVCFTGELTGIIHGQRATREIAQGFATDRGMVVQKGVTKSLDILVAADASSASGKARKAHRYGVRVISEPVFWQWMGVQVEA